MPRADDKTSAVLLAVSELLGREVALDDLLARIGRRVALAMNADRGTLYLVDHGKGEVISKVPDLKDLKEIRLKVGHGIAGHVAKTGDVVNVPTTTKDARFFKGV